MSNKSYVSEERLAQMHENIVEAPIMEEAEADYLIGVKDGNLYRVSK